jgi:hypothetical protein
MLVALKSKEILFANKEMETLVSHITTQQSFKQKVASFLLQRHAADNNENNGEKLQSSMMSGKSQIGSSSSDNHVMNLWDFMFG